MKHLLLLVLACFLLVACQENQSSQAADKPAPAASAESVTTAGSDKSVTEKTGQNSPASEAGLKDELAHHNFILKNVDGRDFNSTNPDGSRREPPFMSFGEWPNVHGKMCNNFRGMAEVAGNILSLKNAATTMMMCLNDLNEVETAFYKMMNTGASVKVEGRELTISGEGHSMVFTLSDYVN